VKQHIPKTTVHRSRATWATYLYFHVAEFVELARECSGLQCGWFLSVEASNSAIAEGPRCRVGA